MKRSRYRVTKTMRKSSWLLSEIPAAFLPERNGLLAIKIIEMLLVASHIECSWWVPSHCWGRAGSLALGIRYQKCSAVLTTRRRKSRISMENTCDISPARRCVCNRGAMWVSSGAWIMIQATDNRLQASPPTKPHAVIITKTAREC